MSPTRSTLRFSAFDEVNATCVFAGLVERAVQPSFQPPVRLNTLLSLSPAGLNSSELLSE
jgi:hypothetical protein